MDTKKLLTAFANPSELTKIEMEIGFYLGILVSVIAIAISILFFSSLAWYFKVFSAIGEISVIGFQLMGLMNSIQKRKGYLEHVKMMKEMGQEVQVIPVEELSRTEILTEQED